MVEFKLYYDDNGDCICYTCENLEGNYIVVDTEVFAEARPDVKVINGVLIKPSSIAKIVKLVPSNIGTTCAIENILMIVDDSYDGETITWEEKLYESRPY